MTGTTGTEEQPAKHYNRVVQAWGYLLQDDLHYGYFSNGDESLVEATNALTNEMLRLADTQAGNKVLDIGCGTGNAACRLASEFSANVIGISPSTQCIEDATARAAENELAASVSFQIGNGMAPDFQDNTFDRVWIMESSHLMKDKLALIGEASRVLRPGGRVILCDIMLHHELSFQESIQYAKQLLLLKDVYGEGAMEPLSFYKEQFESSGLSIIEARDITQETLPTFDRWYSNAITNKAVVVELIGEDGYQEFVDSCDVLRTLWNKDILGYGIIAGQKTA